MAIEICPYVEDVLYQYLKWLKKGEVSFVLVILFPCTGNLIQSPRKQHVTQFYDRYWRRRNKAKNLQHRITCRNCKYNVKQGPQLHPDVRAFLCSLQDVRMQWSINSFRAHILLWSSPCHKAHFYRWAKTRSNVPFGFKLHWSGSELCHREYCIRSRQLVGFPFNRVGLALWS